MTNLVCALLAVFGFSLVPSPTLADVDAAREKLRPILDAIATIESNNRDDAIGDGGKALGRFQLWRVYWSDALQYVPEIGGTYDDVRGREYAERCVVAYWLRYCPEAVASEDAQTLARIHNGGPKGAKRKATLRYWRKVEKNLEKSRAGA